MSEKHNNLTTGEGLANNATEGSFEGVFARRIRVLRRVLGINASELDRQAKFSPGTTGRLERGNQRIYASHLYRIGETAKVGIDYFYMGLDGNEKETQTIKTDIDYLLNLLDSTKTKDVRGNTKILANLLAAELTEELTEELAGELDSTEEE